MLTICTTQLLVVLYYIGFSYTPSVSVYKACDRATQRPRKNPTAHTGFYYLNRFAASLHGCPHATSSLRSYRPARDTHAAIMAVRFGTAQFRGPINLTS